MYIRFDNYNFDTFLLAIAMSNMSVMTNLPNRIKQVDRTQEPQVMSE